jgi:cell division protein FtsN
MRGLIAISLLFFGLTLSAGAADQPDAVAEFYAGHAALQQGDPQQAIEHFSKALTLGKLEQTQVAYVHHYRAIAFQRLDRQQEAIDDYTQALAIGTLPQRVQAAIYYNRAIALDHLANFDRAIKDYTQAIALKPDYAEAYMNRGNAYRKLGDNDAALKDYQMSAQYGNPIKQLPYYGEGLVLESKGDKVGAFKAFQTALLLAPDFEPARLKVEGYKAAGMTSTATATLASGTTAATKPTESIAAATPSPSASPTMPAPSSSTVSKMASAAPTGVSGSVKPATDTSVAAGATKPDAAKPANAKPEKPIQLAMKNQDSVPGPGGASMPSAPAPSAMATKPVAPTPSLPMGVPPASSAGGAIGTATSAAPATSTATAPAAAVTPTTIASAGPAAAIGSEGAAAVPAIGSTPAPAKPSAPAHDAGGGSYMVQVGAYTSQDMAQGQASQLTGKYGDLLSNLSPDIQRADLGAKGVYFRLRFGPFNSKADASDRCSQLKSRGQACIIVAGAV